MLNASLVLRNWQPTGRHISANWLAAAHCLAPDGSLWRSRSLALHRPLLMVVCAERIKGPDVKMFIQMNGRPPRRASSCWLGPSSSGGLFQFIVLLIFIRLTATYTACRRS